MVPADGAPHPDGAVKAAAGLQIGEDLHPKFRAFGLLSPEPEDLATAVR